MRYWKAWKPSPGERVRVKLDTTSYAGRTGKVISGWGYAGRYRIRFETDVEGIMELCVWTAEIEPWTWLDEMLQLV